MLNIDFSAAESAAFPEKYSAIADIIGALKVAGVMGCRCPNAQCPKRAAAVDAQLQVTQKMLGASWETHRPQVELWLSNEAHSPTTSETFVDSIYALF